MGLNDSFLDEVRLEEVFESSGEGGIDVHSFDGEHLEHLIPDGGEHFLELGLFVDLLLLLQNTSRHNVLPRKGKHEGKSMRQHACVLDQI
jgi:hypothetical protein